MGISWCPLLHAQVGRVRGARSSKHPAPAISSCYRAPAAAMTWRRPDFPEAGASTVGEIVVQLGAETVRRLRCGIESTHGHSGWNSFGNSTTICWARPIRCRFRC